MTNRIAHLLPEFAELDRRESYEACLLAQWESRLELARQLVWRERLAAAHAEGRLATAQELFVEIADHLATIRALVKSPKP